MEKIVIILSFLMIIGCNSKPDQAQNVAELPNFDALWNFQDPMQTELKFRELIRQAEKSGDQSYYLQLMTQIARTHSLRFEFEKSHAILDTVEQQLSDKLIVAKIRYYLERGRAFNSNGEIDKARPLFLDAWKVGLENKEYYWAIDAAHMMGIVEPAEKQLDWSLKALDLAENTEDKRAKGWLGALYNNIGWTYHDLGEYENALGLFKKGLNWRQEIKDDYGARIAKWTIGRVYRSLNRLDEALEIQYKLEKEIEVGQLPPDGYVFEEIGECLQIKGESEKAAPYFEKAFRLLSQDKWLQKNEPDRLKRLKELSR